MFTYERKVHFEEVDAAGIVFFGRYLNYAHEAMEAFFAGVEGGYESLIMVRRIGFPAVHVTIDYRAPLRYGDRIGIDVDVTKIGKTSFVLRYGMVRQDGVDVATVEHTCVCSDLRGPTKIAFPDDVRAILQKHLVTS